MSKFYREIEDINTEMIKMGSKAEQLVEDAIKSLLTADIKLAREVIVRDQQIDDAENKITNTTIRLLAINQPVAGDLRLLSAVFRLVTDLERVADLAVNLAWRTIAINEEIERRAPLSPLLNQMSLTAKAMLNKALDSLAQRNDQSAYQVCYSDDELDALHQEHRQETINLMQQQPELVPWGVECILAGNYLERIGDHITNLCEEIIYLVCGQVIRHQEGMKYKR